MGEPKSLSEEMKELVWFSWSFKERVLTGEPSVLSLMI